MAGFPQMCFIANTVKSPNIIVGDYTYYDDPDDSENFERNVLYHFPFIGDRLIIGRFCAIARGVKFIMNGANHKVAGISTYPFQIFGNGWEKVMPRAEDLPYKGDTIVGNDVWIGYEALAWWGWPVERISANLDASSRVTSRSCSAAPARAPELRERAAVRRRARAQEVSRVDAPADVVATQTIAANGRQVPIPFELDFTPQRIEPNRRYALRAEIRAAGGELMFTTTAYHAVLEPGAANEGIEIARFDVKSG